MNVILIIVTSLMSLGLFSQYKTNKMESDTETPKYETVKIFSKFVIRKYPKMILATTKLNTVSYSNNSSKGFRNIANYIFGGNYENMQISMTSPVISSIDDSMSMSFIMPSEYELSELPTPNNQNVKLSTQPEQTMAVIIFGGFANDYDIKYHTKILKEQLIKEGLNANGKVYFQAYDPPFKLFNRTNEVAIVLN
tara:strand:- start:4252 stop:4836 length:585 start_codon:yes stop_codon:yes gene_type:complete